ncbi:uncharacterized protein LOC127260527 [Andrographis paniculata]|uniref:uncharacterized protein LOC127260527 n=1 Tax=Andrographis paniculata TaxID=175694 RepID=UPI0021E88115|nr:uncharacterized protein LOC127260527 [Andrographis paniculata]
MEGLIPFLVRAVKKQRPQNAYRCLSDNSTGRSYHLLVAGGGSGGDDGRIRCDLQPPATAELPIAATVSASDAGNGLRQRGFSTGGRMPA